VRTTASALLLDTRTAYRYATAEDSAEEVVRTSTWRESEVVDRTRCSTERAAFDHLLEEVELAWRGVVEVYGFPQAQGTR
jgi:hypothetical protein